MANEARALVVGVTGITGHNAAERLLASGWDVVGVSRTPPAGMPGVRHVAVDVTDEAATRSALAAAGRPPRGAATPLGARRLRSDARLLRHVVAAADGGREHPRQRRDAA